MKLSIVLPVYNMESCLQAAIDSIRYQTFSDFQVVCIDDGSTDASPEILHRTAQEDSRFKVYRFDNAGPGESRNRGIDLARGEYVLMLDSDDVFEPTLFERLVERAEMTAADIVVVGSDEFDHETGEHASADYAIKQGQIPDKLIFSSRDMSDYIFMAFVGWPWDKLYRRSFLTDNGLRFPSLPNSEDLYLVFLSLVIAERITVIDDVLIHHRMNRTGSVSNSRLTYPEAFYQSIVMLKDALKTWTDRYGELEWGFLNWALHFTLWNIASLDPGAVRENLLNKLLSGGYGELEVYAHGHDYFAFCRDAADLVSLIRSDDEAARDAVRDGERAPRPSLGIARRGVRKIRRGVDRVVSGTDMASSSLVHVPTRGTLLDPLCPTRGEQAPRLSSDLVAGVEEDPAVSVIMPCYNTERFLAQAMDSVLAQTLTNIEVVAVNDGSTDSTLSMLEDYAAKDPRVKLITGPNGGYGVAMNKGLDAATGRYIAILEPDDWYEPAMLQKLYAVAMIWDADAVKSDFFRFTTDEEGVEHPVVNTTGFKPAQYNRVLCPADDFSLFSMVMMNWTGIYRTDFIREHDIRFHETPGASFQDNSFWFQVFCWAKRLVVVDEPFYHYRVDNSASSINQSNKIYVMLDEYDWIRDFLRKNPELEEHFVGIFNYVRTFNLNFAFSILAPEFRLEFARRYADTYRKARDRGELDPTLFWPDEWARVEAIMASPEDYVEAYGKERKEEEARQEIEAMSPWEKAFFHLGRDGFPAAARWVAGRLVSKIYH